jgi:hypothetical protein
MEFEITEIKMLGQGFGRSLSLRLDAVSEARSASSGFSKSAYTIHAVVPFSPEFGNVQIGQRFSFLRAAETTFHKTISEAALTAIVDSGKNEKLTEPERREFLKANGVNVKKGERV